MATINEAEPKEKVKGFGDPMKTPRRRDGGVSLGKIHH